MPKLHNDTQQNDSVPRKKGEFWSTESGRAEEIVKSRLVPLTRHGYDYKGITTALGKTVGPDCCCCWLAGWTPCGLLSLPAPIMRRLLTRLNPISVDKLAARGGKQKSRSQTVVINNMQYARYLRRVSLAISATYGARARTREEDANRAR